MSLTCSDHYVNAILRGYVGAYFAGVPSQHVNVNFTLILCRLHLSAIIRHKYNLYIRRVTLV